MQPESAGPGIHQALISSSNAAVDELAGAHARTLEKAVAGEFQRQTRRMPFATPARLCGLAAELMHEFAEDLLNDLLMLAERQVAAPGGPPQRGCRVGDPGAEWVMSQLTDALVNGAAAFEDAAPPGARQSVSNVLQICRVDFEWRCRATLGLPSAATLEAERGAGVPNAAPALGWPAGGERPKAAAERSRGPRRAF